MEELIKQFKDEYKTQRQSINIQFNILNAINPNENTHTRILSNLLIYKNIKGYRAFEYFLTEYINKLFSSKTVDDIFMTNEEAKIDAFFRFTIDEVHYGLIIENKIKGAIDQKEQLTRYIEYALELNIEKDKLFVIYLTALGGHPSEISITRDQKDYFGIPIICLNYDDHIINWLEYISKNIIDRDDSIFMTSTDLYRDYISSLHKANLEYEELNSKILKYIEMNYKENVNELINNISKFKTISLPQKHYAETFKTYLNLHRKVNLLTKIQKSVEESYASDIVYSNLRSNYPKICVMSSYNDNFYSITLEYQKHSNNPKLGFSTHFTNNDNKSHELIYFFNKIDNFQFLKPSDHYKWYRSIELNSNIQKDYNLIEDKYFEIINEAINII